MSILVLSFLFFLFIGAGDLPQANTCRKNYIPVVRAEHEEKVKAAVREKKVVIHCDETTNRKGEAVFIILFRVLPAETLSSNLYVASVSILQNADSQECCQAINSVIMKYEIQYNNIVGISSDSARYMTKCVRTLKGLISDDLVHVQCWAHKLDIISKFVPRYLTHLNECVSMTKKAFQNTRKRKHRYLKFLEEKYRYADCRKAVKLFPMPVMTRWGSWIDSALYIQEYLTDLVEYFRGVEDTNEAVKYFQDLRNSEQKAVFFEATFVKEHCVSVSELITLLEGSQYPTAHKLIPKLDSLLAEFDLVRKLLLGQQTTVGLNQLSGERKAKEESKIKGLAEKWHTKLDKMMKEDPSGKTFQAISKLFYLPNVLCAEINVTLIDSVKNIPLLSSIPQNTFLQGYGVFQRQVKECVGVAKNDDCVVSVLEGLVEDHREFAVQCLQAVWFPTSNVDSERGFSAYTKILTDCRTNLRVDNIETMLGLYFGDV